MTNKNHNMETSLIKRAKTEIKPQFPE